MIEIVRDNIKLDGRHIGHIMGDVAFLQLEISQRNERRVREAASEAGVELKGFCNPGQTKIFSDGP